MNHPRATAIAAVVLCAALAVAGSASAHVGQPTLTAQHAFVGDPLWGLDSAEGTLLGLLPDERTAQASTTKLMTLHLTVLALNAGKVLLSDQVTINATEAGIGGSTMADMNGVPLEEGEVVSLETLIRGMMYPSGNNAAWAIARHVAEAYLGVGATADDFVAMMNQHALDDGLVDTHFMNPNGFDDPYEAGVTPAPDEYNHYTTARELAKNIAHAIQDPYFQEVVGFQGTYSDTTTGAPSGPKSYSWSWGFNYPGWEGAKGGGTQNCNGPNNGCMAMSAERIGRRVVLAFMQGQPWTEEAGLFDYGFAQIFHPDAHGTSLPVASVERQELDCLTGERAVTAALTTSDGANVAIWDADVDASTLTKLGQAAVPSTQKGGGGGGKGPFEDVDVAAMPNGDFVVAVRKGANEELSWWTVTGGGSPTLVADGKKSGPAISLAIQPISSTRFLTVAVNPDNVLVLKSWELAGGAITQLATFEDASRVYVEGSAARPLATDIYNGHRVFTAVASSGVTVLDTWVVDAAGAITRLGETALNGIRVNLSTAALPVETVYAGELFPPAYYTVGYRTASGNLALRSFRIAADGTPTEEGSAGLPSVGAEDVRVEGLGVAGVIAAGRDSAGDVDLTVLDAARQGDNSIDLDVIAEHPAFGAATSLGMCESFSTKSEGDYVTSSTGADHQLRLRAFRSGDRP
jgi:D-alanyl-D-alanine carboxypeptidase